MCKKQIRKFFLVNYERYKAIDSFEEYTERVYVHLFTSFDNLEEFHVVHRPKRDYPALTIRHLPRETFASSKLTSLTVKVRTWADCLCLLDGRLNELRTLRVQVDWLDTDPSSPHDLVRGRTWLRFHMRFDLIWRTNENGSDRS